ncbi:MAG: transcription antitermination factor NusB [Anaerolineales bacterium]|uniref:transcription antitermination factor NusB n=1 Tax=Candidatus Villigracilis vicinus TaxID=3140679 RepID=UPI003135A0F2|nr:transcription antitermination factor NusB [Anaerolineales bacterium]MBK9780831.1 transcription antitermination factor NusB [Anaerolineales bacterium]
MKPRTRARALALQVLYETDLSAHLPGEVLKTRLEETTLPPDLAEFARGIIFGVLPMREHLDGVIAKYAPEWPLDQIAAIDRNILRMACWEFAISRDTPVKVAINEAVELAKLFGSDSTARFVNGVLGTLVEHEREISEVLKKEIPHETNLES